MNDAFECVGRGFSTGVLNAALAQLTKDMMYVGRYAVCDWLAYNGITIDHGMNLTVDGLNGFFGHLFLQQVVFYFVATGFLQATVSCRGTVT